MCIGGQLLSSWLSDFGMKKVKYPYSKFSGATICTRTREITMGVRQGLDFQVPFTPLGKTYYHVPTKTLLKLN